MKRSCQAQNGDREVCIQSLDDLQDMLNKMDDNDFITVYKKKQLLCRGILNLEFKEKVLKEYVNKVYDYAFFKYRVYPKYLDPYGSGTGLTELKQELKELIHDFGDNNLKLCFGVDPCPDNSKIHLTEDEEFIVISGEQ